MNKYVSLDLDAASRATDRPEASVALFGGDPVIAPGRITSWPAAKKKHLKALGVVVRSGKYHRVNHPVVSHLERRLTKWAGNWAVRAVGSGTAAIHVELDYFKDRGNHVITTALNWPGAVGPILICGLEPIFIDVDLELAGIDEESAAGAMELDVAAVLVTHLFGNNILAQRTRAAARSRGIALIDDVCQSIGAVKNIVNSVYLESDALALSGNGAKHLGAGELGFVITKDPNLIDHVDHVSLTSSSRSGARIFSPDSQGYNYRPNVFSAAIASARIKGLDQQLRKRRRNATSLWQMISGLSGLFPLFDPADHTHSMLNFPLRIEPEILGFPQGPAGRDFIVKLLRAEGVPVLVWLTRPVFEYLPAVRGRWNAAEFPNTMRLLDTMFCVSEIAPPNDAEIMKLYADAFHKIWSVLPRILRRMPDVVPTA
ncbi:DegT/DnrJ/EryC1/StrS family aminotransferase [Sinorhizobium sp. 7-81]|uniref:DegT/DnrJ/EryC1/StrS family aminotransferase n=1 Tax=Sinorhizobium sp. 8-89 TaxID=3049089 RepID=UPI0024C3A866|nr:DegT/DnrJ/EryC1/StrS family aminotransferase [Sinorhizobium sp. 8-89]MDK1494261.1 DegT/DnrJ/EryC1/StrS family aminotransferase [Sinorhizobium sp. 8-89]